MERVRGIGDEVIEPTEASEHGRFGWVHDPEGGRSEPWEPPPA
jgi:hypothetical protein